MVTGVTGTHSTRQAPTFTTNIRHSHDDTDHDGDRTPRSQEERLLNAIETTPQLLKNKNTADTRPKIPRQERQICGI